MMESHVEEGKREMGGTRVQQQPQKTKKGKSRKQKSFSGEIGGGQNIEV